MSIITNIKKILSRNSIVESENKLKQDLLNLNKENIVTDISQRKGLTICSGLTYAERDYILSDSIITSAIQLYLADILNICQKSSYILQSTVNIKDSTGDNAKKETQAKYVLNQIFSDDLINSIAVNLMTNGEIFLDTKYNKGLNKFTVTETSYSRCTQLLFLNGDVACYVGSNVPIDQDFNNSYNYNLNDKQSEYIEPYEMVRIYTPTFVNSKMSIELNDLDEDCELIKQFGFNNRLYYSNSQSLLKQIYPDWLNGKLLELAVYRDRIAKSRYIQLIGLEVGRLSRETTDQIFDTVKEYFDKQSVIDLERQTFKSVVGNEPFTEYHVYTTRNGIGALDVNNVLNTINTDVNSLADLDYNLNKVFAGLGVPKQYLTGDDDGSALSNGTSLYFISEKYQKRVLSYVRRISSGLRDCVKNLLIQEFGKEYFVNWDFNIEFEVPENNEDIYRVKSSKIDYINSTLDLIDRIEQKKKDDPDSYYSIDEISATIKENLKDFVVNNDIEAEDGKQ